MRPVVVAWLVRHGLPSLRWLVPDYFKLAVIAALASSVIALRLAVRDRASQVHTARAIACAYVGALAGGYVFEAVRALPMALASGSWHSVLHPGRAAYGGLIGASASAALYLVATRQPVVEFFDRIAVGAGLSFTLVRTGCFLAGCDYGVPTAASVAVRFPPGSHAFRDHVARGLIDPTAPASLPVHPTQLYMAFAGLLLFLVLRLVPSRGDGRRFALLTLGYAALRGTIELWRGDASRGAVGPFSTSQLLAVLTVIGVLVAWLVLRRRDVVSSSGVGDPSTR